MAAWISRTGNSIPRAVDSEKLRDNGSTSILCVIMGSILRACMTTLVSSPLSAVEITLHCCRSRSQKLFEMRGQRSRAWRLLGCGTRANCVFPIAQPRRGDQEKEKKKKKEILKLSSSLRWQLRQLPSRALRTNRKRGVVK